MSQPVQFPLNVGILPAQDETGQHFIMMSFQTPFGQYVQKFPLEMVTEGFVQEIANGFRNAVKQAKRSQLGLIVAKDFKG